MRAGLLLASLNLIQGYSDLTNADDRRLRFRDDFLSTQKKPPKVDSLRDNDNETIHILAGLILKSKETGELKTIVASAPPIPQLPLPKYFENDGNADEWDIPPNYEYTLNKQTGMLGKIDDMQETAHKYLKVIAKRTKPVQAVSDGVGEANIKLDKLMEMSEQMDKFDNFVQAQVSAELNAFAYVVLGENITKYNPIEYEQKAQEIKLMLIDQVTRAILNRLPDEALDELEDFIDKDEDFERHEADALVLQKAAEFNVDINTVVFDTTVRFIELYRQGAFDGMSNVIEAENTTMDVLLPVPANIGETAQSDFDNMDEDEFDDWLDGLLKDNP